MVGKGKKSTVRAIRGLLAMIFRLSLCKICETRPRLNDRAEMTISNRGIWKCSIEIRRVLIQTCRNACCEPVAIAADGTLKIEKRLGDSRGKARRCLGSLPLTL